MKSETKKFHSIALYALNYRNFNLRLNYFQSKLSNMFFLKCAIHTKAHSHTQHTQFAIILIHQHTKVTNKQHNKRNVRINSSFFTLFIIIRKTKKKKQRFQKKKKNRKIIIVLFRMTVIRITDRSSKSINFVCIISLELTKNCAVFIVSGKCANEFSRRVT